LWRPTASTYKQVKGFCYLEPRRHIRNITELNGEEAMEFGTVVAAISNAIKIALDAKLVYLYVFGDHFPHLHVHLAPHNDGDIYQDDVVKNSLNLSEETVGSEEVKRMISSINSAMKF
jgi:diadenosine tetraphosphate (Ap4A) HIT family hydrolase